LTTLEAQVQTAKAKALAIAQKFGMGIQSGKITCMFFNTGFETVVVVLKRPLTKLHSIITITALRVPPSNSVVTSRFFVLGSFHKPCHLTPLS
jgi:hypothetical protein